MPANHSAVDTSLTLLGWPRGSGSAPRPGSLCALGVPSDVGNVISRGAAQGPGAIRSAGYGRPGPSEFVYDFGDVDFAGATGSAQHIERILSSVRAIVDADAVPLLIGGDHSVSFAPIATIQQQTAICLIWLDAHTDFSPWDGRDFHNHKQVLRRIETLPGVTRIVQFGYRGVTVGDERQLGAKSKVVTSAEMQRLTPTELLDLIPDDLPCYISIDIDVIDPFCAPGTSAPVPGGILPDTVAELLSLLARNRTIAGVDIVEVNPVEDRNDDTACIAVGLIEAIAQNWEYQIKRRSHRPNPEMRQRQIEESRVT